MSFVAPVECVDYVLETVNEDDPSRVLAMRELTGHLDPKDPGNTLSGSTTITSLNGWVTTITWSLIHDGPIRIPAPTSGGA